MWCALIPFVTTLTASAYFFAGGGGGGGFGGGLGGMFLMCLGGVAGLGVGVGMLGLVGVLILFLRSYLTLLEYVLLFFSTSY